MSLESLAREASRTALATTFGVMFVRTRHAMACLDRQFRSRLVARRRPIDKLKPTVEGPLPPALAGKSAANRFPKAPYRRRTVTQILGPADRAPPPSTHSRD